jgi:hypothetical protein
MQDEAGRTIKTKQVDPSLPATTVMTGMYKFGANELTIMQALHRIVTLLERRYGFDVSKPRSKS